MQTLAQPEADVQISGRPKPQETGFECVGTTLTRMLTNLARHGDLLANDGDCEP